MSRTFLPDGSVVGDWWHTDSATGRVVCDLCPRECHLKDGDRGFCFVRENRAGQMVLSTYGRSTGFCIDPIEKKPLNHFFPGTSVLSFGTAGCNLGCKFCQNWEISKSREVERLSQYATPDAIARAASELGCRSVAFTYNDPVIWAEYAIDSAHACQERGIRSVAVTAGYIHPSARDAFYEAIDAANVDLKGFTEDFYWKTTNAHLAPVLDTLQFLKHQTDVWFEITNLIIPDANDGLDEIQRMADWIVEHLGRDVPVHFTAFHPDFRMQDRPRTPIATLVSAYNIAKKAGIEHVYVGNVHDVERQSTYCPACKSAVLERDGYVLGKFAIENGCCRYCQAKIAGCFDDQPGSWGNQRQVVDMSAWSDRLVQIKTVKESKVTDMPATQAEQSILDVDAMTGEQREQLHALAARMIALFVHDKPVHVGDLLAYENLATLLDKNVYGVFTTLKRGKHLRGCCGLIGSLRPLGESLFNACRRTAIDDHRMPAISPTELPYLSLDISLLEGLEPIQSQGRDRLKAFEIGKHGLHIQRDQRSGLLLPSVSVEQAWSAKEFLEGVCRKAGLDKDDWMREDCNLQRFAGSSIHGEIRRAAYEGLPMRRPLIVNPDQLNTLQKAVARNLIALGLGATPSYYITDVPDGTVHGIVLSLFDSQLKRPMLHLIRLSMRPGIPLQSSLYELTTSAHHALQGLKPASDMRVEIALTILHDPSAHGFISVAKSQVDTPQMLAQIRQSIGIEGIADSCPTSLTLVDEQRETSRGARRAIIVMAGNEHVAVSHHPSDPPEQQIMAAVKALGATDTPVSIFSMDTVSTRPHLMATNGAQPESESREREPAVAGEFYPAEDAERRALVKKIFDDLPPSSRAGNSLVAIMTPHAGLKFSGRVAAMVWREVMFPRRLLMIGPKHTQPGVAWAIAPQSSWKLSESVRFQVDVDLVASLAEHVDGMQLDSAAHRREHGVEVQLPILEFLAPNATFAAIAMHGASWPSIQTAASQLANLLANDPDPPLLVISSDMNHYASELENRRRDRIALDAIFAKDPRGLIDVCQKHEISMCGLVPAALVMQTLVELDIDYDVREVAYATSGDVMKSDRVVGYAGLTFSAHPR